MTVPTARREYPILLLLLMVILAPCCTGDAAPPTIPENWSATVTVESEGTAVTVDMIAAGDERFRVTYPNGTLITDDGRRLWIVDPATNSAAVIPSTLRGAVWDDRVGQIWNIFEAQRILNQACEEGNLTYEGTDTQHGRTVRVVGITGNGTLGEAPTRFREPVYLIRASADAETGVLAGAVFYGHDGEELVRFTFRNMIADPEIPPETFSFVPQTGTTVTLARTLAVTPIFIFDLEKTNPDLLEDLPVPSYLPSGYDFREGSLLPGMYALLLFKNDPGNSLTLYARPADLPDPDPPCGTPRAVMVGNISGELYQSDGQDVLVWTEGGTSFKLTGVIGEEEMVRVATSVGPLS